MELKKTLKGELLISIIDGVFFLISQMNDVISFTAFGV